MSFWEATLVIALAGLVVVLALRSNQLRLLCPRCRSVLVVHGLPKEVEVRPLCPGCGGKMVEVDGA